MGRTGELYRAGRAVFIKRPTHFVWIEGRRLAGSGYPASRGQVEWLMRQGISSIITLTEEPLPRSRTELPGLSYAHIPMIDHEPPSVESLDAASSRIRGELLAGRNVLVHCQAGRGRTMCAIGAYLMRYEGLSGQEAIDRLRRLRKGAVESRQEGALTGYPTRS